MWLNDTLCVIGCGRESGNGWSVVLGVSLGVCHGVHSIVCMCLCVCVTVLVCVWVCDCECLYVSVIVSVRVSVLV